MPDQAQYSFLPWLRRGVIAQAVAAGVTAKDPVTVSLVINATGEGEAPQTVQKNVQLYGPGHIGSIDQRVVVRTMPRAGVRNFEPNYLCGIEFYDEDFPWRYTPALSAGGKLQPWLWLVVLKDDEFTRRSVVEHGLPSIEVNAAAMKTALPDPATTWAWAHTHLNFKADGASPDAIRLQVQAQLNANPNLGCSRLLCPRRLQPETHYTAFLVPAFEKGRLAGLGNEDDAINAVPNAQASWSAAASAPVDFPVYYEWEFVTKNKGDFESLALLLKPINADEAKALENTNRLMDIRDPGWGLHYTGSTGGVQFQTALLPFNQPANTAITDSAATEDGNFVKKLADLVNLGAYPYTVATAATVSNPYFVGNNSDDDPFVVPPLYGSFYRDNALNSTSKTPVRVNPTPLQKDWYNQLNLDPAMRIGAGQGAAIIRQDQEKLMDRAWDQLSQNQEAHQLIKKWNYSLAVSQSFFNKRFLPALQSTTPQGEDSVKAFANLAFMAPMHQALTINNQSFAYTIQQKSMPSAYSRSFTKLIRPGGPLVKRLNKQLPTGTFFVLTTFNPPVTTDNLLYPAVNNVVTYLTNLGHLLIFPPATNAKDQALKSLGFGGYAPVLEALNNLLPFVRTILIIVDPVRPPANGVLYDTLASQLSPQNTIAAKLGSMLPVNNSFTTNSNTNSPLTPPFTAPEFPEAMYKSLADRSTDYILPGLSSIPANRVALFQSNQSFIESFMTGLNHELSREYLWREFPAPLNGTGFRQFWDTRDNQNAGANPEIFKDIKPIASWGATALGTHTPAGAPVQRMVVLVKGDLLRKYPNTEIFLQKAEWKDPLMKSRGPVAATDDTNVRKPLFFAQLDPDYKFVGFDLDKNQALGSGTDPGWFFVLKERAGDIHFGMDIDASTTDPSWPALGDTDENNCINVESAGFKGLPGYTGDRSDRIGAMLYQQPYMLFIHVSRIVS